MGDQEDPEQQRRDKLLLRLLKAPPKPRPKRERGKGKQKTGRGKRSTVAKREPV
jgi:hypothetical protein